MTLPRGDEHLADSVALRVLRSHGMPGSAATRGPGYVNVVWLTDAVAVRVSRSTAASDLVREARLAALLPREVGYPEVLDAGRTEDLEWVLTRRIPGVNLGEAWPGLGWDQRTTAMAEMWERAALVHQLDLDAVRDVIRPSIPFYAAEAEGAVASLERLSSAGVLTAGHVDALVGKLDDFWPALAEQASVVCHGDLSPINAIWDGDHVVALLDFEFAGAGTAYIDLGELLKLVYAPPEPGPPAPIGRGAAECFLVSTARSLGPPERSRALIVGYSVLLESWMVEHHLDSGDAGPPIAQTQAYRLLTALAGSSDGYLAPLIARL